MKLSDYVIEYIVKQKVHHVFEMIGGGIAHLLDSIYQRDDIQAISVRHEQAAAFAAEGYARMNGTLGVAMATSGPGALNLLTGIGSCYFDSVPCLFITGQVNTYEYKFDKPVRQIGFQETDIVSVVKPLTKYATLVVNASSIRYHLEKAIYLAQNGRPGPVLLDIPMNIQRTDINPDQLQSFYDSKEYQQDHSSEVLSNNDLDNVMQLLKNAKRPVILAGGGIRTGNAVKELEQLVAATGVPVVSSLMGLDAISHERKEFVGLIGSYGNRYSNLTLANCDLLFILGSRLDTRQTGTRPDTFGREAKKIHVDIDEFELNEKVKVDLAIHADVKNFLRKLNERMQFWDKQEYRDWYKVIENYKSKFATESAARPDTIDPNGFAQRLSSKLKGNSIICLDVGQHQMWASQSFRMKENQRLLNSGGMGAMGFSLPAAIGASLVEKDRQTIVIAGDGGIQLNIQELDTIIKYRLPIKIFIMNNESLGMVRQFQDLYFEGRRQSTVIGHPDFCSIANAYGLKTYSIKNEEEIDRILDECLQAKGPVLVNVKIDKDSVVNPKLEVNRPIEDMSPPISREELKKLMIIDMIDE